VPVSSCVPHTPLSNQWAPDGEYMWRDLIWICLVTFEILVFIPFSAVHLFQHELWLFLLGAEGWSTQQLFCLSLQPLSSPLLSWWTTDGDQGGKALPTVSEDQVHDHLRNLNVQKSMGLDEMHRRVLMNWLM